MTPNYEIRNKNVAQNFSYFLCFKGSMTHSQNIVGGLEKK